MRLEDYARQAMADSCSMRIYKTLGPSCRTICCCVSLECVCLYLQSKALMDLQNRFVQQEHQLQAATASAAANSTTDGVEVENYLPQERVKQELDMLHNVRMTSILSGQLDRGSQLQSRMHGPTSTAATETHHRSTQRNCKQ